MIRIEIEFDPSKGETLADIVAALQMPKPKELAPLRPKTASDDPVAAHVRANADDPAYASETINLKGGGPATAPTVEILSAARAPIEVPENSVSVNPADVAAAADRMISPRVPGQPSPGRKRRTKEEIAEDEKRGIAPAAAPVEAPPVSVADAAQDAADEAAEKTAGAPTLDDLRRAVGAYTTRFGLPAAVKDIPSMLGGPVAQVPADKLAWAIETVTRATTATDPGKGYTQLHAVGNGADKATPSAEESSRVWVRDDFIAAVNDYADRFDGQHADLKTTKFARFDVPKFLEKAMPGVSKLSEIPDTSDGWERATAAVRAAIDANPFKRAIAS
jgi:hypothetical protein